MPVTADKPAPYAPASAVLDLIQRRRDRGLPTPITSEVLGRAGISQSLIPRTLYALQELDLIDEGGMPTEAFEGLRLATEAEYQQRLEAWLKNAYADVFAFVDLTTDDETAVRDAFRSYEPIGQQPRMVTLFQGLARAAGLLPERASAPRPTSRPRSPSTSTRQQARPRAAKPAQATSSQQLPPAITGLLASLPATGEGWTSESREKFMTTFGAVLDFCFPIVERAESHENGDGQN